MIVHLKYFVHEHREMLAEIGKAALPTGVGLGLAGKRSDLANTPAMQANAEAQSAASAADAVRRALANRDLATLRIEVIAAEAKLRSDSIDASRSKDHDDLTTLINDVKWIRRKPETSSR